MLAPLTDSQSPSPTVSRRLTRVLIATDNPDLSRQLTTELRRLNLDVQLCLFDGQRLSAIPTARPDAILCHLTEYADQAERVGKVLRAQYGCADLPLIGALNQAANAPSGVFDSLIFAPIHPSQIANRVFSMVRLGAMEAEIQRRLLTLRESFDVNESLSDIDSNRRFRILFVGKASPAFMVVINALQNKGVDVVAAFTSFSAFDYLHGDSFDAVVMNALEQSEPSLTISETMRRNAKLYHVPTLFLAKADFRDRDAAFAKGARDIIDIDSAPEEISGRILELANYHRIHEQLKTDILSLAGQYGRDGSGTVFSSEFLDAHLPRLVDAATQTHRPLTLIGLQVNCSCDASIEPSFHEGAIVQTGVLIQNLVRMQDFVARVGDNIFMLAFNDTDAQTGQIILDRIAQLSGETSFDSGPGQTAKLQITLDTTVQEARAGETARHLSERTLLALLKSG